MKTAHSTQFDLKENVDVDKEDDTHTYTLPLTQEIGYSCFDALNRALWSLKPIAQNEDDETYASSFIYAKRRFGRIFETAYDFDSRETHSYKLPTVTDIYANFVGCDDIDSRTFTLEKTEQELRLSYTGGFLATEETLEVEKDETDELKAESIRACGKGMVYEHAPYKPSFSEEWRHRPSKLCFSIEKTGGTTRLGIESTPQPEPLWYRAYKHMSMLSRPHAHTTFNIQNQTSVVKYTYNLGKEKDQHM
jgi:hypothetical protein